jgi:cobalt-precorrin-7 (C5)-methyltransferase
MTEQDPTDIADSSPGEQTTDRPVHAVGIGPGSEAFLTGRTIGLVESADVVTGFETVTDRIEGRTGADVLACSYEDQTAVLERFGERIAEGDRGVAVLWGDPNVSGYAFLGRVEAAVERPVRVVPGVSSIQVAAARSRTPIERSAVASLHRRGDVTGELDRLSDAAASGRHLVALVRPYDWMPPSIAAALLDRGTDPEHEAFVLQDLTLPAESVERTTVGALAAAETADREEYSDRTILTVRVESYCRT